MKFSNVSLRLLAFVAAVCALHSAHAAFSIVPNPCPIPYGSKGTGKSCEEPEVCAAYENKAFCILRPPPAPHCSWPKFEDPVCCKYKWHHFTVTETMSNAVACACHWGVVLFDSPCEMPPHEPGCEPMFNPVCCYQKTNYLTFTAKNHCECRPGETIHHGMCDEPDVPPHRHLSAKDFLVEGPYHDA